MNRLLIDSDYSFIKWDFHILIIGTGMDIGIYGPGTIKHREPKNSDFNKTLHTCKENK